MDYITKEQYEQLKYQIEHNPKRNKKKDRKMTLTLEECNQICHKYLNNDMKKLKEVTRKVIACLLTISMNIIFDYITTASDTVRKVWDIVIKMICVIILIILCYGTGAGILEKFL